MVRRSRQPPLHEDNELAGGARHRQQFDGPRRSEHGAASAESALVFPFLLALFFVIIQGAVTLHAGNLAQSVATATLESARAYDGSIETALDIGYGIAGSSGGALSDVSINVVRSDSSVTVTVTGKAPSLVPGMPLVIEWQVTGPRERWIE